MRFRRRKAETEPPVEAEAPELVNLQAHKYSIQFNISPEISYLNARMCQLLAEFFPLFDGFPEGVWISQQAVDEGLDFCKVSFWAFAEEPDAIKEFSIWFGAVFRRENVIDLLERFIKYALDDPDGLEISLVDWGRAYVTEAELRKAVDNELRLKAD
jgi:hypothetical protein